MSTIQAIQGRSYAATVTAPATPSVPAATGGSAPAPAQDSVQISGAAVAAAAQSRQTPAQEAAETPAQTAKKAAGGDAQAKAKLASEHPVKG